uniref:Uncharacterized protein n=1 Tax=viral metagenome TaxID=1070528 RepID=A0A6H1ZMK0_9ZZZZ
MPETKPIYNEIKQDEPLPEPQKTSETILNPNIIGGNLTIGSGNDVFKANAKGICLGNQVFENAPFKADMKGNIEIGALFWGRQTFIPTFESLDGWGQSAIGTGATIMIKGGACKLTTGNALGNITKIYLEGMIAPVSCNNDPYFQANVSFYSSPTYQDVAVGIGNDTPWAATNFFGFRWSRNDNKMYAYSYAATVETKDEIVGYDSTGDNVLRAEMLKNGTVINYYVNGELKIIKTNLNVSMDSDIYFCFANRCAVAAFNLEAYIWNIIFSQKW